MSRPKKLKQKDETELDRFFIELFGKQIFGAHYQYKPARITAKRIKSFKQ